MKKSFIILSLILVAVGLHAQTFSPSSTRNKILSDWEKLRFGAFVHFNDNTFPLQVYQAKLRPLW